MAVWATPKLTKVEAVGPVGKPRPESGPTLARDLRVGEASLQMSPQQLSSRLISEVQQVVHTFQPSLPNTERDQLAALARAVLSSIDIRDLRGVSGEMLVHQLEHVLSTIRVRKRGEILCTAGQGEDQVFVFESCLEDQPFLVSTIRAFLAAEGMDLRRFFSAIVPVRRDPSGELLSIGAGASESVMRIEASCEGAVAEGVERRLHSRLRLAQAMVRDFEAMKQQVSANADRYFMVAADSEPDRGLRLREAEELLRWICAENFVLLSVEQFDETGEPRETLGVSTIRQSTQRPDLIAADGDDRRVVRFQRSSEESPVHRAGKPGYFMMPRFDEQGRPCGTFVIHGLFAYKAVHTPPEEIPFVRMALRDLLEDRSVRMDSHRGKSMTNAFNSLPLEYLLSERRESVWEVTDRILRAEVEGESDVHIRIGDKSRFAFVIVTLPRSQFSEELRQQVQDILLQALDGTYADSGVYIDRYDNAVVHYYVTGRGALEDANTEQVRAAILALARGWTERLREALAALVGVERVEELFEVYVDAFNDEHKRRVSGERLAADIRCLERLRSGEETDCDLYVSEFGDYPGTLQLRIFSRRALNLSTELPVISNFGFDVIDEYSRPVRLSHVPEVDMDNFRLEVRRMRPGNVMGRRSQIVDGLWAVFAGHVGDDDLNRLVLVSDLDVRDVEILRAYVAYLHQLRVPFDVPLIRSTLVDNPEVAQALMAHLAARFDPSPSKEREDAAGPRLEEELAAVTDFTADRVLQAVADVVRATVRTNAYVPGEQRGQAFAFKIASQRLSFGPSPRPFREIWVYHPDFEGVHLRGGKVARGGLRFSDRPDDFRTEIHGLMATQMVKNVLIVPMGAKGGFVLRNPPKKREQLRAAGDHYYRAFIGALLSVTDNVIDGQTVTPAGVIHDEGDDAYFVVAADKGTAHLSDAANSISMARNFWLDDAFASGGSQGYDHKKTGITARGAWEVTKRSFRELGVDPEVDEVTVIGVGDMSGDVFGNGLLRSQTLKLQAAFNHLHIFVDPDPDPAASYEERKRLFDLGRSQWTDYRAEVLSAGGGVHPRASKEVALSSQAREVLGLGEDEVVNGEQVIRAILRLEVDLCWMGGIGTYVKSRDESNADVGDKANDPVRIDAVDLGCRVLGEGANLAITDEGRVEFARGGGENYTAFLDNSGGVDTSDHEVNIKILLAPLVAQDALDRKRRNELLEAAEEPVVQMVLENNRSQSRMVSYDVRRSRSDVHIYARTMARLARDVPFDPELFSLPEDEELATRERRGQGLYKCEAAVLCAHAKMLVYRELLDSEPLDQALTREMVDAYFPDTIREAAGDATASHLLGREIATTMVVNRIIDNTGATFFAEVTGSTGRCARDVALAYILAAKAGGVLALRRELYALEDPQTQEAVYAAMQLLHVCLEDTTYYLLDQSSSEHLDGASVAKVGSLLDGVELVAPAGARREVEDRLVSLSEAGIPSELARRLARLHYLTSAVDAVRLGQKLGRPPEETMALRLRLADHMQLTRLRYAIGDMATTSSWDGPAANAMSRHLSFHLHKMVLLTRDDDVHGMLETYDLAQLRERVTEHLSSGLTIAALVMLDDHLRRVLPSEVDIAGPRGS